MVSTQEAIASLNLTEDDVLFGVGQLFVPEGGEVISNVNIAGFLLNEETYTIELLLEITIDWPESESWTSFYSYIPETNSIFKLDSSCLFDPLRMDQMEPPLFYQNY